MPTDQINQDEINKAVWAACDTFRGVITNISACMGFDEDKPCKSALLDKDKLSIINQLIEVLSLQINEAEEGSPMHKSLQAQLES